MAITLKDINSSIEAGNEDLQKLNDNFSKWFESQRRARLDMLEDKKEGGKLLKGAALGAAATGKATPGGGGGLDVPGAGIFSRIANFLRINALPISAAGALGTTGYVAATRPRRNLRRQTAIQNLKLTRLQNNLAELELKDTKELDENLRKTEKEKARAKTRALQRSKDRLIGSDEEGMQRRSDSRNQTQKAARAEIARRAALARLRQKMMFRSVNEGLVGSRNLGMFDVDGSIKTRSQGPRLQTDARGGTYELSRDGKRVRVVQNGITGKYVDLTSKTGMAIVEGKFTGRITSSRTSLDPRQGAFDFEGQRTKGPTKAFSMGTGGRTMRGTNMGAVPKVSGSGLGTTAKITNRLSAGMNAAMRNLDGGMNTLTAKQMQSIKFIQRSLSRVMPLITAGLLIELVENPTMSKEDKIIQGGQLIGGAIGGMTGAGIGALIGTAIFPGVGTIGGAILGGFLGGFAGDRLGITLMKLVLGADTSLSAALKAYGTEFNNARVMHSTLIGKDGESYTTPNASTFKAPDFVRGTSATGMFMANVNEVGNINQAYGTGPNNLTMHSTPEYKAAVAKYKAAAFAKNNPELRTFHGISNTAAQVAQAKNMAVVADSVSLAGSGSGSAMNFSGNGNDNSQNTNVNNINMNNTDPQPEDTFFRRVFGQNWIPFDGR